LEFIGVTIPFDGALASSEDGREDDEIYASVPVLFYWEKMG